MAVYIDDAEKPYRSRTNRLYKLNHMIADTMDELQEMALKNLGLKMEWFQPGSFPHYDITIAKKKEAIKHGAIPLSQKELVRKIQELRKTEEYAQKSK